MEPLFGRTRLLLGESAMDALSGASVIVVGVGGVGGWCAEALVRSGIGHIAVVDDDMVAPSNANRQVTATADTVGLAKAEVLARRLRAINPALRIEARCERYAPETAGDFALGDYNAVIDAIDSVSCKAHLLREACACGTGTAVFSSMGAAGRTDPGRIRSSRFSKVSGDALAKALRTRFRRDGGFPSRDFTCVWSDEPMENRGTRLPEDGRANGSYMPVTAAFGMHLAALAVRAIAG